MAIPLWRQYTRLSRDERDAILGRRRRRLNAASDSQREILAAFLQDAREVRSAYRRRGGARPEAEETRAPRVDRASRFAQRQEMLNSVSDPTDRQIADTVTSRNQSLDVASVPGRITELRAQRNRELAQAFRDGRINVTQYNNSREPQVVNNWVQNELLND
jgi:hypothetical protein